MTGVPDDAALHPRIDTFWVGTKEPQINNGPVPKFLTVLSTLIERAPTRAVCVVLPTVGDGGLLLATLVALGRLKQSIPARILDYANAEFTPGELVSVLPHGYVYEFAGVIQHSTGAHFKLRVLDRTDGLSRSLPVREILRLERTERRTPKGKDNSVLGLVAPTPMERLLDVQTSGNGAVVTTQVLLSSSATSYNAFALNTTIAAESTEAACYLVSDVTPWASIAVDGGWRMQNREDGAPLVAVSSAIDRLRDASQKLERDTSIVVIDGARRVQNIDHLHEMSERQKTLILAASEESELLRDLERAGITIWQPNPDEIVESGGPLVGPGREMVRGAAIAARLSFTAPVLPASILDNAATALRAAEKGFTPEMESTAGDAIGQCFRLLLRLSEWYLDPTQAMRVDARNRFDAIATRMRMVAHFLPPTVNVALDAAMSSIGAFLDSGRGSEAKLQILRELLSPGSASAVILRTPEAAEQLTEFISPLHRNVAIAIGRGLPVGSTYDELVLAAWPGTSVLQGLIGRLNSPSVTLIGHEYERIWFDGFVHRRRAALRSWKIEGKERRDLLGLPETKEVEHVINVGHAGLAELTSVARLEAIGRPPRKGSETEPGQASLETNYVGFCGSTYAYVTPRHSLLRMEPATDGRGLQIGRAQVEELHLGDRLLFRDVGDTDVLAMIAEVMFPDYADVRRTAGRWRMALKEMGLTPNGTYRQLKRFGLVREEATVRGWLLDPSRIGPQEEKDLVIIADAARDEELRRDAPRIWKAITDVRGAHLSAGTKLTDILLAELPASLGSMHDEEFRIQLSLGELWVVQVEDIGTQTEQRAVSIVNRLLWDDRFL